MSPALRELVEMLARAAFEELARREPAERPEKAESRAEFTENRTAG